MHSYFIHLPINMHVGLRLCRTHKNNTGLRNEILLATALMSILCLYHIIIAKLGAISSHYEVLTMVKKKNN